MYYDKANSHLLDADVFFFDILISTKLIEFDGEEVINFLFIN